MSDFFRDKLGEINNKPTTFTVVINITSVSGATAIVDDVSNLTLGMQLVFNTALVLYLTNINPSTKTITCSNTITGAEPTSITASMAVKDKILGGWDAHNKNYVLSIQEPDTVDGEGNIIENFVTSNFDEDVQGWTSRFSYKPTYMLSLDSSFYSFYAGKLWLHHVQPEEGVTGYGNYYGTVTDSTVKVILNSQPSLVKNFKTISYEGDTGWQLSSMIASSSDATLPINAYVAATSINDLEQQIFSLNFKKKENKFFANLQQDLTTNITPQPGEVLWGSDISGIKGFWSTVVMKVNNTTYYNIKKELFAVSSNTVESSY